MKTFSLLALLASTALPSCAAPSPPTVTEAPQATAPNAVGTTRIAHWKDDKKGVFLLMFDDGWPSGWQVALPELKKRGMIGTFYVVPGKGEYKQFEKIWLNDVVAAGMVLGNHTMTHNGFQGKADTEMEINDSTQYLLKNVPGKNPRLISFALPGVNDYDFGGLDFKALLAQNNLVDRPDFKGHGANYHFKTLPEYLAFADKAIATGSVEYIVFHGLERITPNWGFQDMWAVPQSVFLPFLDGLQERRDRGDLWITDHISATKYEREVKTARVRTLEATGKKIALELKADTDAQLYDEPLTLITQVPDKWTKCTVAQGQTSVEAVAEKGQLRFEALPDGGPITLTTAKD